VGGEDIGLARRFLQSASEWLGPVVDGSAARLLLGEHDAPDEVRGAPGDVGDVTADLELDRHGASCG
jgi:hypothetical protein